MMPRPRPFAFVALVALILTHPVHAQSVRQQDSTLDNLLHAPGYVTAPLGTLGRVTQRGAGRVDVVLIPGWGFDESAFETFIQAHASRYRVTTVTLPGFGGTPAPPMPPPGTSYASATWIRAAEEAIAREIERRQLRDPIVVGHFIVGSQVALRLALDHPDRVGALVIVGGEPMRYLPSRRDSGKTMMSRDERIAGVDGMLAPRWFRTVTRATWDANNFPAAQYSRDSVRAARLWKSSANVPMPVMIRYLCEYSAMDLDDDWRAVSVPTFVLTPSFTPEILATPNLRLLYIDAWQRLGAANPKITVRPVADSRIFIWDDQPDAFRQAIDDAALARRRRAP